MASIRDPYIKIYFSKGFRGQPRRLQGSGLGFRIWGLGWGFRVYGLGSRGSGLGMATYRIKGPWKRGRKDLSRQSWRIPHGHLTAKPPGFGCRV